MANYNKRHERQYWIDPYGEIHKWNGTEEEAKDIISLHYEIAHQLYPEAKYPDDILYDLGWIAVSVTNFGTIIKQELTSEQIETCIAVGIDYTKIRKNI